MFLELAIDDHVGHVEVSMVVDVVVLVVVAIRCHVTVLAPIVVLLLANVQVFLRGECIVEGVHGVGDVLVSIYRKWT